MGVSMAGMALQITSTTQAPCHEASQPMQAEGLDCCSSQAMCHAACPVLMLPFFLGTLVGFPMHASAPASLETMFQSADPSAGFKPPIL